MNARVTCDKDLRHKLSFFFFGQYSAARESGKAFATPPVASYSPAEYDFVIPLCIVYWSPPNLCQSRTETHFQDSKRGKLAKRLVKLNGTRGSVRTPVNIQEKE